LLWELEVAMSGTNVESTLKSVTNIGTDSFSSKETTLLNGKFESDPELITKLDKHAIEDVVELKISRFLDQLGSYYPENLHELIMAKVEKPLVSQILRRVGGNQVHAAKILGINRNTLRKKIRLYGL